MVFILLTCVVESLRVAARRGCAVGDVDDEPDPCCAGVGDVPGEVGGGVVAPVMMVVGNTGMAPGTIRA
jgi:hypothetical protein